MNHPVPAARAVPDAPAAPAAPAVLSVEGLSVRFRMPAGRYVEAVTDAGFRLAPGECLALVGESGCGKSVLASALLGLLPGNAETAGSARLADGLDLLAADERTLARTVRGRRVGLVPQSPAAHLTPVRTVRSHLEETVRELGPDDPEPRPEPTPAPTHDPTSASVSGPASVSGCEPASGHASASASAPASGAAPRLFPRRRRRPSRGRVRVAAQAAGARAAFPADHLDRYPHELSGGLAQRAATALALVGDAPLLLADEPTTGLDRDLVHRTADELRAHTRDAGRALLMITHDLAAAERIADTVAVMYAGRIVELSPARAFFGAPGPRHPYARGLLEALPERAFVPVPGAPPELGALPDGCAFAARCPLADALCRAERPVLTEGVACHRA
ncbi:ABC transporter ATP-binding protein [Streptomyces xanthophaeus]|uniref:ABC transporter ATP-binding protein n=1 Tax=Streptomyces xanthophaeus TaxID=67385 RepID=A0A919LBR8_9ACTN|nr:ABC transporter ATP-binding protein [Streptomyces xanthophaeus]